MLVKNRIDAYDINQNLGTPLQKLKISDAITLCSNAWNEVTAETIKNCWLKTGILPNSEDAMQVDTDTSSDDQQVSELQNLINQFNTIEVSDRLDAAEFVTIDNNDDPDTEITDEEIISCVRPTTLQMEPEGNNVALQTITTTEVLKSLDTVISYIKNPPQDLVFELKHINSINVIKNQIARHEINSRKQATLDKWFK